MYNTKREIQYRHISALYTAFYTYRQIYFFTSGGPLNAWWKGQRLIKIYVKIISPNLYYYHTIICIVYHVYLINIKVIRKSLFLVQ